MSERRTTSTVIGAIIVFCLSFPAIVAGNTIKEFTGEVDFAFSYNDLRSQRQKVDPNSYLLSTLLNLEIERESEDGDSPWTFYVSYQLTALDRYPVDFTGVDVSPYRYWARHIGKKHELRLGMQKIVFGPARYLRPLRLFDNINPNDFTKKTPGTKSLMGKYFPREDLQVQSWVLYNEFDSSEYHFGGRVNKVTSRGEFAFTYHDWQPDFGRVEEQIFGFDFSADIEIGLWLEHASHNVAQGQDFNQTTIGLDYTFPHVGNGLHVSFEHMVTTDGDYAHLNRNSALFFDTRLNDEDTLYLAYVREHLLDINTVNLRLIRDISEEMSGELGFDWVDKEIDELPVIPNQTIPLREGVTLRLVYNF